METTTCIIDRLSDDLKKEIIAYQEKNQPEYYWDYRDELSDKEIQKIFKSKDGLFEVQDEIWEHSIDYISEIEQHAQKECADFFEDEITEQTGESRGVWEDDFYEWLLDYISIDFNIEQLLRNTPDPVFFYDTGEEFTGYGNSEAEYRLDRIRIKKTLGIKNSDHDEKIMMMLYQASYGGQLVVYFRADISSLLDSLKNNPNTIRFSNAYIAIINTENGSGDHCHISGHSFELPFDNKNLFYEKSVHYNYTYDVCSMYSDWCNETECRLLTQENPGEAKSSSLNAIQSQEEEYQRIYDSGSCSFGDTNISRHRNTEYINNFPCGTRCNDCSQFWID